MKEKEIEVFADNGEYSHSEIINSETGEFICFICPICGARWKDNEPTHCSVDIEYDYLS